MAFLVRDEEIAAFLARGAEDRDAEKRRTLVLRVPEGLLGDHWTLCGDVCVRIRMCRLRSERVLIFGTDECTVREGELEEGEVEEGPAPLAAAAVAAAAMELEGGAADGAAGGAAAGSKRGAEAAGAEEGD